MPNDDNDAPRARSKYRLVSVAWARFRSFVYVKEFVVLCVSLAVWTTAALTWTRLALWPSPGSPATTAPAPTPSSLLPTIVVSMRQAADAAYDIKSLDQALGTRLAVVIAVRQEWETSREPEAAWQLHLALVQLGDVFKAQRDHTAAKREYDEADLVLGYCEPSLRTSVAAFYSGVRRAVEERSLQASAAPQANLWYLLGEARALAQHQDDPHRRSVVAGAVAQIAFELEPNASVQERLLLLEILRTEVDRILCDGDSSISPSDVRFAIKTWSSLLEKLQSDTEHTD